jgi:hypothetical protein
MASERLLDGLINRPPHLARRASDLTKGGVAAIAA